MIWANVTKFGQNFIAPQTFLGWYGYASDDTAAGFVHDDTDDTHTCTSLNGSSFNGKIA